MNSFQIATVVVSVLVLIVLVMDYKQRKDFNKFLMKKSEPKKPCSCHGQDTTTPYAPVDRGEEDSQLAPIVM